MFQEVRRILRTSKGSARNQTLTAVAHIAGWPLGRVARLVWPWRRRVVPPRKILLVRIDGIGDLVMSSAIFPSLRRQFPRAGIDLLTSAAAAPIADRFVAQGWVDRVWRMPLLGRGLGRYRALARELRAERYDAGVDLRGDPRNAMLLFAAGIPVRVGLCGSGLGYLLTDRVDAGPRRHQAEEAEALLRRLGVERFDPLPCVPVEPGQSAEARQWLADQGIDLSRPVCAFHLGAFYPVKLWPLERFVETADRLAERISAQCIVVGGPDERELAQAFKEKTAARTVIAAGAMSLPKTADLLGECDAFVGSDSGPAHLAASVGCPVVVLFGPADADRYHPRGPRVVVMRPRTPCDARCDKTCARPGTHCMLDHTVEAVAQAVETLARESVAKRVATDAR